MMMRRYDWRSRLHRWASAQVGRPFAWGVTDCGTLARAALEEMFGQSVGTDFLPPHWESALAATRVVTAAGGMGPILRRLGAEEVPAIAFTRVGDIVVLTDAEETVGHEAALVCLADHRVLVSGIAGVRIERWARDLAGAVAYSLWELTDHG